MKKLVLVLAAIAAAASAADYLAWRKSHRALRDLAAQTGLTGLRPDFEIALRRQTEPARAATLLAATLAGVELDRAWLAELPADQRAQQTRLGLERLRAARRLAAETLPRRPASWQAAMALGITRYLEAERTGRRQQPADAWRRPLRAAISLAPGQGGPPLLLASASLSRWSSLSPAERQETRPVLARALREPTGLDLLIPAWVRLAPSLGALLAVVPDRPEAWRRLEREFHAMGDLERSATARQRWLDSLPARLTEQLEQARSRLRGGAPHLAFDLARRVAAAPACLAFADELSEAVAILPDGFAHEGAGRDLRRWLLWALDLCLIGDCPLEERTLDRLAGLVPDLAPPHAGLAALAAGDLAAADALEPGGGPDSDPEWHRYWVFKARRLAVARPEAARRALDRAAASGREDPLYWRAAESLAEASGDAAALALASAELERLGRGPRPATSWSFRHPFLRLVLTASGPHRAVRLEVLDVPAAGAAVELRWDGAILGVAALQPGEDLHWRLPIDPGVHQIEVASLYGRRLQLGALTLEPAPPG